MDFACTPMDSGSRAYSAETAASAAKAGSPCSLGRNDDQVIGPDETFEATGGMGFLPGRDNFEPSGNQSFRQMFFPSSICCRAGKEE